MPIVNMVVLLNQLQKFYLSSANQQNIAINLGNPINDYIYLNVTRRYSYNDTVFVFLKQLNLYLSRISNVYEANYPSNKIVTNGVQTLVSAKNTLYNNHYTKYITSYNLNEGTIAYDPKN